MFEPRKPVKFTREQLDALVKQSKMFREYCENVISLAELSKSNIETFPFLGIGGIEEHVESTLEQMHIYKNYFEMTETYLGLVACNIDMWHAMYIDKKKTNKNSKDSNT